MHPDVRRLKPPGQRPRVTGRAVKSRQDCGQDLTMSTDRIETNPATLGGKPVIRGTRISVELVLRKLADGATEAELLDGYPRLTREDIRAALAYAADTVAQEVFLNAKSA